MLAVFQEIETRHGAGYKFIVLPDGFQGDVLLCKAHASHDGDGQGDQYHSFHIG